MIESAEALALLAVVLIFWCRTGVARYFRPGFRHLQIRPIESLPQALAGPIEDLERLGFRRVGIQVERGPLELFADDSMVALALPSEGIYANIAESSTSDVPALYFFTSFTDGAWALTHLGSFSVPSLDRWVPRNDVLYGVLWARDAALRASVDTGVQVFGPGGWCRSWTGSDYVAQGMDKASWAEFPQAIAAHREVVEKLAASHGTPTAEPTPEARLAAARRYYDHPALKLQSRAAGRAGVVGMCYGLMMGALSAAMVVWAAHAPSRAARPRSPMTPVTANRRSAGR